jgi:hypothetical protein
MGEFFRGRKDSHRDSPDPVTVSAADECSNIFLRNNQLGSAVSVLHAVRNLSIAQSLESCLLGPDCFLQLNAFKLIEDYDQYGHGGQ